jgi:hypothetical protein
MRAIINVNRVNRCTTCDGAHRDLVAQEIGAELAEGRYVARSGDTVGDMEHDAR